jgi:aspartate kinase
MGIIVQKFGGTSLGSIERIRHAADLIIREKMRGNSVVVVVSAMGGVTDDLVRLANSAAANKLRSREELQEYDSILSAGEQISSGLLALALRAKGCKAKSWLGWQLPIETDSNNANGKITNLEIKEISKSIEEGVIPVIAGFQGVCDEGRIVTLGRGGTDITAAAAAAALGATRCDIYTDVIGVFTSDPRIVGARARKLDYITYEEMLEMAFSGAKVLHARAVEIAIKYNLKMQVLSSFEDLPGTMLIDEEDVVEQSLVTGITCIDSEVCVTVTEVAHAPGNAAQIFKVLSDHDINVDMIVQNPSKSQYTNLSFTIDKKDLEATEKALASLDSGCFAEMVVDANVTKISVVGIGMKTHAGVAQKMFHILSEKGINILVISTSEIKISVLVPAEYKELAVRALHTGYGLDKQEAI